MPVGDMVVDRELVGVGLELANVVGQLVQPVRSRLVVTLDLEMKVGGAALEEQSAPILHLPPIRPRHVFGERLVEGVLPHEQIDAVRRLFHLVRLKGVEKGEVAVLAVASDHVRIGPFGQVGEDVG